MIWHRLKDHIFPQLGTSLLSAFHSASERVSALMETFSSAPITKIPGSISSVLDLEHQINDKCEKGFGWTQPYIMHRHLLPGGGGGVLPYETDGDARRLA